MISKFLSQNKFAWVYIVGLFLILTLPLLSIAPWFHPPAFAKNIVFRTILSLLFFFFIYQILFQRYGSSFSEIAKDVFNRKSKIFWPIWLLVSYLGIFFLATFFSLDFHYSFWGSPYRGMGFLSFAFSIVFALFIFFISRKKDWQRFWDFSFVIGILICFMAIFQKFSLFSDYIVAYSWRPIASMGGAMFLALYLLLLVFLAFSFGIKVKGKKKIFYFFSIFMFLFAILLTATRSVFLGIFIGLLFFIFFFPNIREKHKNKLLWLKILTGIILILGVLGINWLQTQPQVVESLRKSSILGTAFHRVWSNVGDFSIDKITASRGSGWIVALRAVKDRPILGYGPENFSIAFDRHYDPTFVGIVKEPDGGGSSGWWDRGHNFMIDTIISAGIPALIIYLLFFIVLFYSLQKVKKRQFEYSLICHGIQATFIAYFTANFFNFDVFSSYLILSLLIGYSLFLIYKDDKSLQVGNENTQKEKFGYKEHGPWKYILIVILSLLVIWFIWSANLKPLLINKELNMASFYSVRDQCGKAIEINEKLLDSHSFLDNYVRLQYIDTLSECSKQHVTRKIELAHRAIQILEETMELRPYYTRIWLYYNSYTNTIVDEDKNLDLETKEGLIENAYHAIEKAYELSPNRQEVFLSWARTDMIIADFENADKRIDQCISINPKFGDCWWLKALIYINQGKIEEGTEYMEIAEQKGTNLNDKKTLNQLLKVYIRLVKEKEGFKYYRTIADIYEKLIELDYENFQYHASLAFTYKTLGEYDKAREQAMIVIELSPESKVNVDAFLKTLPQ